MINWKNIIIGLVLAIILGNLLSMVTGLSSYIGFLLATIYVGYAVGGDYTNGAINGALVGVIAAIIVGIIVMITSGVLAEGFTFILPVLLLMGAVVYGIVGAVGGIIGIFIKERRSSKGSTA